MPIFLITSAPLTLCSGKSSVLEGLTGIAYPRASTLCTRFATQITFRRSPVEKISVSVIPAANAQPEYAKKLREWKRDDLKHFNSEVFGQILREVWNHCSVPCGIPGNGIDSRRQI